MNAHPPRSATQALLVAGLLAAGCGGSSDSGGGSDSAALKASDINPTPRAQLRDGGGVRWAVDQFSTQWNLNELDGPTDATAKVMQALMPRPFRADDQAKITPNTNYVRSAEVTDTSPRQVVTYTLNPRARWSDGKPITYRDFAAQWRAMRSATGKYQIATSTGYERIAGVERGSSPYEVVVTFAKPFGEWQAIFDPLYPAATNSDPERFNTGYVNKIPVTAGPFKLRKIDRTAKAVTLVRDPKWWGQPPKLDSIVFRALPDDAVVNSFANGEVDVGDVGSDPAGYKRAEGVPGGAVREAGGPDFRHITINGSGPALSDVRVRRAVAMAIDRDVIARADLAGLNWPARTMGNHFLVNTQTGYRDNSGEVGRFDAAKARALLDQAGWKLSGPYRRKNAKTLSLRFVIPSGVGVSRQEGELTQKMLQDVGIKLDIRTVPTDDLFDKYVVPGNFDLAPFAYLGNPFPLFTSKSVYIKPTKDAKGELQIQQNYARVGSPKIDRLMAAGEEAVDRTKGLELINRADALVWDEVHSLILYQRPQITAVKATLGNVGSEGLAYRRYEDIGFVK
ncbi:MAG: ABC transporter family substrate-binding protein [Actinomycetota bacterium]|nr:ABC transporter family substrate-binding protein [Actinomycetota bacterium]